MGLRGGQDEDEAHEEVGGEYVAGLDGAESHEAAGQEAIECVEALGCCEDVCYCHVMSALLLFSM